MSRGAGGRRPGVKPAPAAEQPTSVVGEIERPEQPVALEDGEHHDAVLGDAVDQSIGTEEHLAHVSVRKLRDATAGPRALRRTRRTPPERLDPGTRRCRVIGCDVLADGDENRWQRARSSEASLFLPRAPPNGAEPSVKAPTELFVAHDPAGVVIAEALAYGGGQAVVSGQAIELLWREQDRRRLPFCVTTNGRRVPRSVRILCERCALSSPMGTMSSATWRESLGVFSDLFMGLNSDCSPRRSKRWGPCLRRSTQVLRRAAHVEERSGGLARAVAHALRLHRPSADIGT